MVGKDEPRPGNAERIMPSATFSLRRHHIKAIREVARRRHVSQSEVVRQILDLAYPQGVSSPVGGEAEPALCKPDQYVSPAMAPVIKELAATRRELASLRVLVARLEEAADRLFRSASEANEPEQPTEAES